MKTCDQHYRVVDYFFGELRGEEKQQFEQHLSQCEICRDHLDALAVTSRAVSRHQREQPEKALLKNYHRQLEDSFLDPAASRSLVAKILERFVWRPSIPLRLAEAAVLLLVGILIGKMTIWKPVPAPEPITQNETTLATQGELLMLKNYLQQTEMILLDVANLDPVEDQKLIFNLIQSTRYKYLLQKTLLLRDEASQLENHQLSDILDQIELILLELYNMERNSYVETLSIIKRHLKNSHLLIEMKSLDENGI